MIGYVALMGGSLIFTLFYLVLRTRYRRRLQMEQRLQAISELKIDDEPLTDERLRLPLNERVLYPLLRSAGQRLQRLAPSAMRTGIERQLAMAGLQITPEQWSGWYVVASGLGLVMGVLVGSMLQQGALFRLLLAIFMLLLGGYLPRLLLIQSIARRQKAIVRALPDVLDLLTVSVKAGLGFDSALLKVTEKMKGPLAEELSKVLHEIKVGVMRKDALKSLADRTGVAELQGFVGTIIQADQLGVSISNVLMLQAENLRQKRRQAAEEMGMKAPIKMLFPLILFIFPTLFIVLLGPALIQVFTNLFG